MLPIIQKMQQPQPVLPPQVVVQPSPQPSVDPMAVMSRAFEMFREYATVCAAASSPSPSTETLAASTRLVPEAALDPGALPADHVLILSPGPQGQPG